MGLFFENIRTWVWGAPLLFLFLITGIYLTIQLKGVQFRYLGFALQQVIAPSQKKARGDISHFEALMTTLAGAIGTGSIVGVATGVAIGGLGSLFWMWVMAFLGMAIKYSESLLAVKFRIVDSKKEILGGPMQYIEQGLGKKWMAKLFAVLAIIAVIGTGNLVQANAIADAVYVVWQVNPWVTGAVVSFFCALVIIGGVKSIGRVAAVLVPLMALFYIGGGITVITMFYDRIPEALSKIFYSAFSSKAAAGGAFGGGLMLTISMGIARSVFSNEAGLGITSIAAAAAITDSPARQAMVTMTGALLSTFIVCTITGLVLATSGVLDQGFATGSELTIRAFQSMTDLGDYVVAIGLILFAFSTVIAWGYYGEKCIEYLFGVKAVKYYRVIYALAIIPGAALNVTLVWHFADVANGLMAIPNLIALILLSPLVVEETRKFLLQVSQERT